MDQPLAGQGSNLDHRLHPRTASSRPPLPHQGYIDLLTAPECGLAITGTSLHCSCARFPEYTTECRFNARGSTGQLGALQVQFSRPIGGNLELYQEEPDDYEARRKLYRPIPSHLLRGSAETLGLPDLIP
ncbi:hypothetical protein [Streptomyces sp. NPDC029674]|uniref:hypothetical protein n=1 Tax=Streptomyces sp. NPDC029674 TaxID=3365297 RepID=UPI00384E6C4C